MYLLIMYFFDKYQEKITNVLKILFCIAGNYDGDKANQNNLI